MGKLTYAKIKDKNEMQTNKVEHLQRNKKFLILIFVIEFGIRTIMEIIEERHNE